jgi:Tol biopolymer transport system component
VVADETKGYEADKMTLLLILTAMNLTEGWDGTVDSFLWSKDGKKVYFTAAVDGTKQLFEVNFPGMTKIATVCNR